MKYTILIHLYIRLVFSLGADEYNEGDGDEDVN